MRQLTAIVLLFLSGIFPAPAQQANKPLAAIVAAIAGHNTFESRYVGFAASPSQQYARSAQLATLASLPELLQLSALHTHPVVRIYSWIAIAAQPEAERRKYLKGIDLLRRKHLADTTKVFTLEGCIGGSATVSSLVGMFEKQ